MTTPDTSSEGDAPPEQPSAPVSALPAPLQKVAEWAPALARLIQFGWRLGERWSFDRCALIAAAMAFFGLLSLFPVVLAVVAVMGKVLAGNKQVLDSFLGYVQQFFPGTSGGILSQVRAIADSPNAASIGLISVASLLWSGRAYFDTLAGVLNTIWPHARPRTFAQHQVALWSTFVGAGLLWLLSTAATFALSAARSVSDRLPDLFVNRQPVLWNGLTIVLSWLLTTLMFWMMYRFLPNAPPGRRGRLALVAALIAAIGWELAKVAFTRYLGNAARYGAIYGGVASVVLTMMWLYFSSTIILLGAEAAAAYAETTAAARGEAKPTQDKPGDMGKALGPAAEARTATNGAMAPDVTAAFGRDGQS